MSCNYRRIMPRPVPVKLYGFQKVAPQDLNHIVMRLQRRTYSGQDPRRAYRPSSALCRKADLDDTVYRRRPRTAVTPQLINRINRRLQRSTVSRQAAQGLLTPTYEHDMMDQRSVCSESSLDRPKSGQEHEKMLQRIQRPTTATRRRQPCALLEENKKSGVADYDYSNEYHAEDDEIDEIVERLTVTTVASRGREGRESICGRTSVKDYCYRKDLPLISGLAKSRGVDEITERLYKPFRRTPAATATTYQ